MQQGSAMSGSDVRYRNARGQLATTEMSIVGSPWRTTAAYPEPYQSCPSFANELYRLGSRNPLVAHCREVRSRHLHAKATTSSPNDSRHSLRSALLSSGPADCQQALALGNHQDRSYRNGYRRWIPAFRGNHPGNLALVTVAFRANLGGANQRFPHGPRRGLFALQPATATN